MVDGGREGLERGIWGWKGEFGGGEREMGVKELDIVFVNSEKNGGYWVKGEGEELFQGVWLLKGR